MSKEDLIDEVLGKVSNDLMRARELLIHAFRVGYRIAGHKYNQGTAASNTQIDSEGTPAIATLLRDTMKQSAIKLEKEVPDLRLV